MEPHGPDLWLFRPAHSDKEVADPLSFKPLKTPRFSHRLPPHPRRAKKGYSGKGDSLLSNLKWSAGLHAALALLIVMKSLIFPGDPPTYRPALRVDLVGLPEILKKDLKDISAALPAAESASEIESEPEKKTPSRSETSERAAPNEMVLQKKKESLTDKNRKKLKEFLKEQANNREREKKLKSALARMKSLARIRSQISDQSAQNEAGILIKGNKISKGFSLSGEATEQAEASYYDLVKAKLQEVWELPVWLSRQNFSAKVEIFIDNRGIVRNMRFTKPSGNSQFDEAIRRTVSQAQPFPKPPKEYEDSLLVHGISLGFPL